MANTKISATIDTSVQTYVEGERFTETSATQERPTLKLSDTRALSTDEVSAVLTASVEQTEAVDAQQIFDVMQPTDDGFELELHYYRNQQNGAVSFYIDAAFGKPLSDELSHLLKQLSPQIGFEAAGTITFPVVGPVAGHLIEAVSDFSNYALLHVVESGESEEAEVRALVKQGLFPNDTTVDSKDFTTPALEMLRLGIPLRFSPDAERDFYEVYHPELYPSIPTERIAAPGMTIYVQLNKKPGESMPTRFGSFYRGARWNVMYERLGVDARDFGIANLELVLNLCERAFGQSPYEFMIEHNQMLDVINIEEHLATIGEERGRFTLYNVDSHTDLNLTPFSSEEMLIGNLRYLEGKRGGWNAVDYGTWINASLQCTPAIDEFIWQCPAEVAVTVALCLDTLQAEGHGTGTAWQMAGPQSWVVIPVNDKNKVDFVDRENGEHRRTIHTSEGSPLIFVSDTEKLKPFQGHPDYRIVDIRAVSDAFDYDDDEILRVIKRMLHYKYDFTLSDGAFGDIDVSKLIKQLGYDSTGYSAKNEAELKALIPRVRENLKRLFAPVRALKLQDKNVILTTDLDSMSCWSTYMKPFTFGVSEDNFVSYLRSILATGMKPVIHGVCESPGYVGPAQYREVHFLNSLLSIYGRENKSFDVIAKHRGPRSFTALGMRDDIEEGKLGWLMYLASALKPESLKAIDWERLDESFNLSIHGPQAQLVFELARRWDGVGEAAIGKIRAMADQENMIAGSKIDDSLTVSADAQTIHHWRALVESKGDYDEGKRQWKWEAPGIDVSSASTYDMIVFELKEEFAHPYRQIRIEAGGYTSTPNATKLKSYAVDKDGNYLPLTQKKTNEYLKRSLVNAEKS